MMFQTKYIEKWVMALSVYIFLKVVHPSVLSQKTCGVTRNNCCPVRHVLPVKLEFHYRRYWWQCVMRREKDCIAYIDMEWIRCLYNKRITTEFDSTATLCTEIIVTIHMEAGSRTHLRQMFLSFLHIIQQLRGRPDANYWETSLWNM